MLEFWLLFAGLLIVASLFVLCPLWFHLPDRLATHTQTRQQNIGLYRERLAMIDASLASGHLETADHRLQVVELQRTFLDELDDGPLLTSQTKYHKCSLWILLLVAVLVTLAGIGNYVWLGHYNGLQQQYHRQQTRDIIAASDSLAHVVRNLQAALQEFPNNSEGWYALAHSLLELGQLEAGLDAMQKTLALLPANSLQRHELLGEYAQTLFYVDGQFSKRVLAALAEAYHADSDNTAVLSLLGIQAMAIDQYQTAIEYWQRALQGTQRESQRSVLAAGINNARRLLQQQSSGQVIEPILTVNISLAPTLALPTAQQAVLFVYARLPGQRMPLLATKLDPRQLPLQVRLSDALTLRTDLPLAEVKQLDIVAHLALAGIPGRTQVICWGELSGVTVNGNQSIDLVIDRVIDTINPE